MGGPQLRPPEPLSRDHDVSNFDCGYADLNAWLVKQAATSEGKTARTIIVAAGNRVVAYYCLAAGSIARTELPSAKLRRNVPDQVPVVVIGRLAVDLKFQGKGFGRGLLKDAILRALTASESLGIRAIVVHAVDDKAAAFYKKFGFINSPTNALTFLLPTETAKQAL